VPTGALHRLPLHALPWPTRDQRLLDGYTVSYATSADVLPLAADKPAAPTGVAALAPGLPPEQPLPGTLAEASHLAARAAVAPLLRTQATHAALLEQRVAAHVRWVLVATHGRAGGGDPTRAGLLLYDDEGAHPAWLSASEILCLLPLDGVEHLGLGACSTHADTATAGDRLAGLLRALLYRGARSVQATLWPVHDDAAALVSAWTWEALLEGETNKARALRGAVQRLRRCTGREAAAELRRLAAGLPLPANDPAYGHLEAMARTVAKEGRPFLLSPTWAPFVLHGAPLTTLPA
jgi:CHAT domain-containing protein